jgi:hypothetical protein
VLSEGLRLAPLLITMVITLFYPIASFTPHHAWTFVSSEPRWHRREATVWRGHGDRGGFRT